METAMDLDSVESRSGEAMSIFGHSIDVRRSGRDRRRATHKILSPGMEQQARPTTDRRRHRRAVAERERARAEFELSRATTMAKQLERQIEQASAKANSHRSELQRTRARGSSRTNVEAPPGADQAAEEGNTLYVEVMQELDRVKSELRKLQREVKSAREAKARAEAERDAAETPTPGRATTMSSSGSRISGSVNREAGGGATEERVIVELAEAGGLGGNEGTTQMLQATRRTRGKGTRRGGASRASDTDGTAFATASSSSDVLRRHGEVMAMVRVTTEETGHDHAIDKNSDSAQTITRHEEHDDDGASRQAAEAELNSARTELASIRDEKLRFAASIERTRKETARVAEELARIAEQEEKAGAQVRQLSARLARARCKLDAAAAADEGADAALAELSLAVRRVEEEAEAAEKEKALTELEARCVAEDAERVAAEVAEAERRVRRAVRELEAARAAEASAAAELKAMVDGGAVVARAAVAEEASERSSGGNVTVPRVEYEYLTGRGEVVKAAAEKKVAAAEAWVEALQAGEKELAMRADAIEAEIGEQTLAGEAEDAAEHETPRDGSPRAHPSRGPARASRASSATPAARKKSDGTWEDAAVVVDFIGAEAWIKESVNANLYEAYR